MDKKVKCFENLVNTKRSNLASVILLEHEIENVKKKIEDGDVSIPTHHYLATLKRELVIIKHLATSAISSAGLTIEEWEEQLEHAKVYVVDEEYMDVLIHSKENLDKLAKIFK